MAVSLVVHVEDCMLPVRDATIHIKRRTVMRTLFLTALAVVLTLCWGSAHAEFAIAIDDPTTQGVDIVVEDNGPGDINPLMSIVQYCPLLSDLETCVTGYSKDRRGTAEMPKLSLAVAYIKNWPKSIRVALTDTGFNIGPSTATAVVSGLINSGDSVVVDFYGDTDNRAFEAGFPITTMGPYDSTDGELEEIKDAASDSVGSLTISAFFETSNDVDIDASFVIDLELNPASADVDVPNLVGLEENDAKDTILDEGLTIGTVTTQADETVASGFVISQDPAAGTIVAPATSVDLVVSSGPGETQVPVEYPPGLSGSWYDPDLNGEGYEVGVTPVGLLLYYYGRDTSANRLWLTSSIYDGAIVFGQSITLTLLQSTSGTFSSPSHELEEWGTLVIIFDTCTSGRVQMTGKDGTKTANIVKLVGIGDLDCDL